MRAPTEAERSSRRSSPARCSLQMGAIRQQRNRSDDERHPTGSRCNEIAISSSSASAAITAIPMDCSLKPAAVSLTLGTASSPGIPKSIAGNTVLVPYNNLAPLREVFAKYPTKLAAISRRAVAENMGVVPPAPDIFKACESYVTMTAHC